VADWGGKVAAWFAGVAAASATLAGLVWQASKQPMHGWVHVLFIGLVVIGAGSFIALLFTGPRALWSAWLRPVSRIDILQERDRLAAAQAEQWADEEHLHKIHDPEPLPVQWDTGPSEAALAQGAPVPPNGLAGQFGDIAPLFVRLPSRRLVILGDAGAGKSVLVTKLAQDLLAHDATTLVPVIVPASAWDPDTDLPNWNAGQLRRSLPGLTRRVRAATGKVVTLAYALATDKVLPIIDGLDEMPAAERARAIIQINDFGSDKPLVVTSRPREYLDAVAAVGRAISLAAVIELKPLHTSQARAYLTAATAANPAGRWQRVFKRLDAGPDEPLTLVLSTPLMLWLARTVYEHSESKPAELLDRARFPDAQALEHHLLDAFVPAVYRRRRPGFRCTARQAERWLGYLASYLDDTGQRGFAWWRMPRAVRGWRMAATTVRTVLGITAVWVIVNQVLVRHGYWRDDHYHRRGSLHAIVLGGPLGHLIRPAAHHVFTDVRDRLNTYWNEFLRSGHPFNYLLPWHSLAAFMWAIAALGILLGLAVAVVDTTDAGPSTLRVRILPVLRGSVAGLLTRAVLMSVVIAGLLALLYKKGVTPGSFLRTHTTWHALGVISLLGLSVVPAYLRIPLDVSGSLSPAKALRLSQQADVIETTSRRLIVAAVVWLWAGPQIAVAYGIYAALVTVLSGSVLGGATGAAPVYADARNCLAATRRMPWRMMPFLADAHKRGVLRQVGAVYEFRHIRLQEHLAAEHPRWATRARDLAERELQKHLPPRIAVALDDRNRIIADDEWAQQHGLQITVRSGGRLRIYRDPRLDRFAADASGSHIRPQKHLPRIAVALGDRNRIIMDDEWARQHGLQITVRGGGRLHIYRDPRLDRFAADASGSHEDKGQQPSELPGG